MIHQRARYSHVASVELDFRLRASGGLREIDVRGNAALHGLSDPRLKIIEPSDAQRHPTLRHAISATDAYISLRVGALPVGVFDPASQRAVAVALKRDGDFERRTAEAAVRVEPARRRAGKSLQPRGHLDGPTRETFGRHITGGIGDKLQIFSRAAHAALRFHLTGNL